MPSSLSADPEQTGYIRLSDMASLICSLDSTPLSRYSSMRLSPHRAASSISWGAAFENFTNPVPKRFVSSLITLSSSADGWSILFINTIKGILRALRRFQRVTVWLWIPSVPLTISMAISSTSRVLSISELKSECPGVSISTAFRRPRENLASFENTVMPLARSIESVSRKASR